MFSCPKPKRPLYHHLIGKGLAGHLHQRPGTPLMTVSESGPGTATRPGKEAGRWGEGPSLHGEALISILRFSKSPHPLRHWL